MKISSFSTALALAASLSLSPALAEDVYNVALDGTFAPHAMPKLDGGVEGFNVDLAEALGTELGATLNVTAAQWSGLLPGMQAGTYDFLVAPTTVTEERTKSILFSEGYLNTDFQFLVKADAEEVESLEGFKGKVIAVNKGSAYDQWARELTDTVGWEVESYGTNSDAVQAVMSGRAFANVAGNTVSAWAAKKNPALKLSYLHSTGKVFALPFPKDKPELRAKIEGALECLKQKGTLAALSEKWFGVTPAEGSAAATIYPGYGIPGLEGYVAETHELSCS
ncbi:polar amino acid ABC transporter substrate-binding protein [Roseibium polysiphoniae]|uniref:Polar amino acid ABC transporter substrate-binding protein n=1 Tax=Roseibium polysiphoniae TaxID=2571221 RepID=A0A944CBB7_9HYPH|nr:transporter substrate-binding domain-containing protein [Roseibium polysiphoniae]MBS8259873.1 polar amino acid ABC transporter substrate-binding protein [Roseibium polysiphoniae]